VRATRYLTIGVSASRHRSGPRDERFDTLTHIVPIAVIAFDFDPLLRIADALVVRWQTIALAIVIAAALFAAGAMARRAFLRPDDLLFIAVGIVPGAVIGGRLGYTLLHLDYYGTSPLAILDPAGGGLELALAVAGGLLTAGYVAKLLDAPIGPWLHVAVLPLLFALGAGKLTMVLGGAGQGQPSGAAWATAFLGPGPWSSLAPSLPSHPSQAYEGVATLIVLVLAVSVLAAWARPSGSPDGRALFLGVGAWALVRAVVSVTWRDPTVLGPLNAGSLIALGLAGLCLAAAGVLMARGRHDAPSGTMATAPPSAPIPQWPDPEERPRF
jgi:prolipoprotein diacylglyceryltransferase